MLVLTRRPGEWVRLFLPDGRCVRVRADWCRGGVRLCIDAPPDVGVLREELLPVEEPEMGEAA